jgi:hypothetical protein
MTLHIVRIAGLIALLVLCTFYPVLPGGYDPLAVSLSAMAQTFGIVGLLVLPVGLAWLVSELQKRARRKRNLPAKGRGYYFALASMMTASIVAVAAVFAALINGGLAFAVLTLGVLCYIGSRLIPKLKLLKKAEAENFNPAPLYLVFIPVIVLGFQLILVPRATNVSRHRAIAQSAELIGDIEAYHAAYGRYPSSLLALHKDYKPSVVGIEQFHYAPNGQAYNLFFEQPTFVTDFGIREIVMYNRLDEHVMVSHAAWILAGPPDELEARQGWHSVHDASTPHWKLFWFD